MSSQAPTASLFTKQSISSLIVRPVSHIEKPVWRDLMSRFHYLGFRKTAGESVLYVATIEEKWIALLAWAAPALHVGVREEWIGWDNFVRSKRLHLVVNNTRFLILPEVAIRNLASKILSMNTERLSHDWQQFYGHPILLAETFVDPSRFNGTCYRAAGWKEIGRTAGFSRQAKGRGFYIPHGNPKMYFALPLIKDACKKLSNPFFEDRKHEEYFAMDIRRLPIEGRGGLIEILRSIQDPREKKGRRHSITPVLAIATSAMLSGARGYSGIAQWGKNLSKKQLVKLRCQTSPSVSTYKRVLQRIDPIEFDEKICKWLISVSGEPTSKGVAVDGKSLRGTADKNKKKFIFSVPYYTRKN